jgi:polar amino acid transport system substrate-binding protein
MSRFPRLLASCLIFVGMIANAQTVVRVGSTPTGIPFTFLDTKTNQISGVMVDLINQIGKDQGFTTEITPMTFSTLIASLTANKIDVIAAAMYITPPRLEVVDFSDPIYTYGDGMFVAAKDTKDYKSYEDLKGEIVGAQIGTAYVKPLQDSGCSRRSRSTTRFRHHARRQSRTDQGRLRRLPDRCVQPEPGSFPETRLAKNYKAAVVGSVGIATRKGDKATLDKVNTALRKFKADGTIDKILAKWNLK